MEWISLPRSCAGLPLAIPARLGSRGHRGVQLEQLLQPFGVVAEAATEVDALQHLVVALVSLAQISGHGLLRVVQLRDGGRKMCLARQEDVFGAAGKVGLIL